MRLKVSLLVLVLLASSGCSVRPVIRVGPEISREVVFVHTVDDDGNPVEVGRVAKNVTVPVVFVKEDGTKFIKEVDIGAWGVVHPNAMKTKEPKRP